MGNKGATGPFAPLVVAIRNVYGTKNFNLLRGKAISLHSQGKGPLSEGRVFRIASKGGGGASECASEEELSGRRARERETAATISPQRCSLFFSSSFHPSSHQATPLPSKKQQQQNRKTPVIKEFGKSIGVDTKQVQGLIRLAKKNGEKLGFLA